MKITEIDYVDLGNGKVKIIDFRNVATKSQIMKEFGEEVWHRYRHGGQPSYYIISGYKMFRLRIKQNGRINYQLIKIFKGKTLTKKCFHNIIESMKEAAERLIRIREEIKKEQIKTIKI